MINSKKIKTDAQIILSHLGELFLEEGTSLSVSYAPELRVPILYLRDLGLVKNGKSPFHSEVVFTFKEDDLVPIPEEVKTEAVTARLSAKARVGIIDHGLESFLSMAFEPKLISFSVAGDTQ